MTKLIQYVIVVLILCGCNSGTTMSEQVELNEDTIQEGYELPVIDELDSSSLLPSKETSNKPGEIATH